MARSKTWADYELQNLQTATEEQLRAAVRRAAKAANQRLLRLERAGKQDRYSYKQAMQDLVNRKRFTENTQKLKIAALRREYKLLRSFLSMKGSTVSGLNATDEKRYQKAVSKGFEGSFEEFYELVNRYFGKAIDEFFDSHVVYQAIRTGTTHILDKILEKEKEAPNKKEPERKKRGRRILEYLEEYEKEKKSIPKTDT